MLEMVLLTILVFEFILKLKTRWNCLKFFSIWDYSVRAKICIWELQEQRLRYQLLL